MTNIQAALGLAQIERLDEFIKIKELWVNGIPLFSRI